MLDHDEERQLAEIEDQLRLDAPDLHALFAGAQARIRERDLGMPRWGRPAHPVLRSAAAFGAVVALTAATTWAVGPNLGGLVAVVGLCVAGMHAYQLVRARPLAED